MDEPALHCAALAGPTPGEYARFGPWVDEIASADELPRLYRDHPIDFAAALLVLKVPRNIARRDARPDMDLYDHVVVLEPDRLTVLSRIVAAAERLVGSNRRTTCGPCPWPTSSPCGTSSGCSTRR